MPKLQPHSGFFAYRRPLLPVIAILALMLVAEGFFIARFKPSAPVRNEEAFAEQAKTPAPASVLSAHDLSAYRQAFDLQQAGQLDEADAAIAQASDPLLRGVLLGERYLAHGCNPSFSELALWLARYGDHAQAGDLYRLARERTPEDADFLTEPQLMVTLKGFGGAHDRSMLAGQAHWGAGMQAYRKQDMATAILHFAALVNEEELSSDDRAAAAFWAYRASNAIGDTITAAKYLNLAASAPPGFYGILARQVSGERLVSQEDNAVATSNADFLRRDSVRRAVALKAIGQDALTEKELHALFLVSNTQDRPRLAKLAQSLGLAGAQMRMTVTGAYDASHRNTLYPMPRWKPTLGYHVEPALLFAIMRQESGFNPHAKSASGATGVMQLMPATASAMARDARLKLSGEPAVSMTLGQHYLERLMDTSSIGDNLVFLIAAYNAGPGSVAAWQKSVDYGEDPLLFIESIPSAQTRDYVVSVMGNYWVYSSMLGGYESQSASALAKNRWPHYERSEKQMASMLSHLAGGAE